MLPRTMETLTPVDRYNEYVMTSLRTSQGCALAEVTRMGPEFLDTFLQGIAAPLQAGWLEEILAGAARSHQREELVGDRRHRPRLRQRDALDKGLRRLARQRRLVDIRGPHGVGDTDLGEELAPARRAGRRLRRAVAGQTRLRLRRCGRKISLRAHCGLLA